MMLSISCLESKLLNNNNWYGRFQLAPFQKGEGLTVANALRRTLLAEKSNFFITWVDFYNAEIPYSVLTGMRESIFDILLNLKQVIFTSDKIIPNRNVFLKSTSINNFKPQKVKFLSKKKTFRGGVESEINFLDPKEHDLKITPNGINKQTIQINQNFKNKKTYRPSPDFKNVFCKNQILGKIINSNHEVSPLVQLGIFNKSTSIKNQFLDSSNSKKMANSTYIGYICAKGPTIIYAKNIKLPKGLKCVDPDKYIVTLADDGLFYLRFALTTEIQTLSSIDASNLSISVNQGVPFNNVRLNAFPKTLFNKEIQSCSSFRIISSIINKGHALNEKKLKKLNQQYLNNNQIQFLESNPMAKNILKQSMSSLEPKKSVTGNKPFKSELELEYYYKQKYHDFTNSVVSRKPNSSRLSLAKLKDPLFTFKRYKVENEKEIPFISQIKLYNSTIDPVPINLVKNLIKEQRLLLTNDSIKQFNFQNISIIANIQKTCLLNLQIKHYYYKCGRFDRFLFDLIKSFKPTLKSTYYHEISLKKKETFFYQSNNISVLTNFHKIFSRQKYGSQLSINYKPYNSKGNTSFCIKTHSCLKNTIQASPVLNGWALPTTKTIFQKPPYFLLGCVKQWGGTKKKPPQGRIDKLLNNISLKNNINGFPHRLLWKNHDLISTENYSIKNKYFGFSLVRWQKILKSIQTSSIYDYLTKLTTSQAPLTILLSTKPGIKNKISWLGFAYGENFGSKENKMCRAMGWNRNKKKISISVCLPFGVLNTNAFIFSSLDQNITQFFSFVSFQSKMLKLHKPYIQKFLTLCVSFQCYQNNILWFLKSYLLQHNNSLKFLNKNPIRKKNTSAFPKLELTNLLFLEKQNKVLELLSWMKKNQKPKQDYHLREFSRDHRTSSIANHLKKRWSITKKTYRLPPDFFSSVNNLHSLTGFMGISGYMSDGLFYKKSRQWPLSLTKPPWTYGPKNKSVNSFPLSTNLRTKPFGSIRQISYKPVWIIPCHFQQNTNLLRSWLDNKNFSDFENAQTTKNKFLNVSYLAKKSTNQPFNSIPTNSVISKPIYLNVEQIIYILKQTTKFCKNQRINPIFFNSFKKLKNDRIFPADYYLKFSQVSNSLYNSLFKPFRRDGADLKIKVKPIMGPDILNFGYFKNKSGPCFYIKNTETYNRQMFKKNYFNRPALSHVCVYGSNFLFKSNLSSISLKSESNLFYGSQFFLKAPGQCLVYCFWKASKLYQHTLNQIIPWNLTTINYSSKIAIASKHSSFYSNKITSAIRYQERKGNNKYPSGGREIKRYDLYNEPYNINISNSKISFNLRYTYPFKYTIFETFLPFQSIHRSLTKIGEMFISNKRRNKAFQNTHALLMAERKPKRYGETQQFLPDLVPSSAYNERLCSAIGGNPNMFSYPHFDFIQYNESFKIYTTLAYTCLKTDESLLPKYHHFNKQYRKKLQNGNFKKMSFQQPGFKNLKSSRVLSSKQPSFRDSKIQPRFSFLIKRKCLFEQNSLFEPSIWNYESLKKNNKPLLKYFSKNKHLLDKISKISYFQPIPLLFLKSFSSQDVLSVMANKTMAHFGFFQKQKYGSAGNFTPKEAIEKYGSSGGEQIIIYKIFLKILTICRNNTFGFNNELLPSIFDNTYKWRIMNNPNFNDAFIAIPCTWSLNFQSTGLRLDELRYLTHGFSSFLPTVQNIFFINYVFQNLNKILFLDFFGKSKEIIKNKLYWSGLPGRFTLSKPIVWNDSSSRELITTDTNSMLKTMSPSRKKNTEFQISSKDYDEDTYKHRSAKKLSSIIPKSKNIRSLKKLAINFENIYYKNFLWNSRKITLRILNNAVLPLVANRKYNISNFIPKNYYGVKAFINVNMPLSFSFSLNFSAPFVYNHNVFPDRESRPSFYKNKKNNAWNHINFDNMVLFLVSKTINNITKNWLHQSFLANPLSRINNYQKLRFYSIKHKTLETTNFMCSQTYPIFINENENMWPSNSLIDQGGALNEKKLLGDSSRKFEKYVSDSGSGSVEKETVFSSKKDKIYPLIRWDPANKWQKQGFDSFFQSFSSLRFKWRPFFYGSLNHFKEKNGSFDSPLVNFATGNRKQSENNQEYLLPYNQITPEKLVSFRRRQWTEKLSKRSKLSNSNNTSRNDNKVKSPLNSNLWWSSFFCRYSLYAISTRSDLFLQNLISFFGLKNQSKDESPFFQTEPVVSLQAKPGGETELENTDTNNSLIYNTKEIKKNLDEPVFFKKMQSQYKQNDIYQFLNTKPFIKSYEKTMEAPLVVSQLSARWGATQKILKSQDDSLVNYFVSGYYKWQKAIHFTIFQGLKTSKFNEKKSVDSVSQNSLIVPKNKYYVRRLKNYQHDFGNPLRRPISKKSLSIYNIKSLTKLYPKFITEKFFLGIGNQHMIKSWKSIICTPEANIYFCFHYPRFLQNCNGPWQKSRSIFGISKHWLNKKIIYLKPPQGQFNWISSNYLSKTPTGTNLNKGTNNNLFMFYTPLTSSSNKTHQNLSDILVSPVVLSQGEQKYGTLPFALLTSAVHKQNQGFYGTVGYFTIKEGLNSIYKVNYIVESRVSESKPISELEFHSNQKNGFVNFGANLERLHTVKRFEDLEDNSATTDSLTVSNFLNDTYSFVPSKTIMLSSFNELINSPINKSEIQNENEYIQIDIWTNGELSPRQALLNAFKKLFELFYNLSKYNCLKPIEI